MKNKIITQIQDCLRGSSLATEDTFILALQILAWMKLSHSSRISESFCLDARVLNDPSKAASIMWELNNIEDGLIKQAFAGDRYLRAEPIAIIPALDLVLRLNESGVLQSFNPIDAVTLLSGIASSDCSLPCEVAELLTCLAEIKAGDTAYVPWDIGAQLAGRLAAGGARVYLEQPQSSPIPALVSLLCDKSFEVYSTDPIKSPSAIEGGKMRQFDVAVAFSPVGQRHDLRIIDQDWFGRFPERTPAGAVLALRHMLSQATRRVVIGVPNSLLFSPGAERQLREFLINKGIIQSVIAMPSGLLAWSNIPFSILVLDPSSVHECIRFINADSGVYKESLSKAKCRLQNIDKLISLVKGNSESEDMANVTRQEVLENDTQLQVSRYVLPDSQKQLQSLIAKSKKVSLGGVVKTIRPMPVTQNDEGVIDVHEVGAADLPQYGYITSTSRSLKVDQSIASRNEHQFLQPYDIVLIIKGSVGKIGIVPKSVPPPGEQGWIAGQSATVLRCSTPSSMDARALFTQLRSPLGRQFINTIVSGATIPLIQLRELERLEVLIPDKITTSRAIEALEQEAEIQKNIDQLVKQQSKISSELWALS